MMPYAASGGQQGSPNDRYRNSNADTKYEKTKKKTDAGTDTTDVKAQKQS